MPAVRRAPSTSKSLADRTAPNTGAHTLPAELSRDNRISMNDRRPQVQGLAGDQLSLFIDKVANALKLNASYRAELHAFKQLVVDLPDYFWRTTIYQQASIYRSLQLSEELREDVQAIKTEVKDVGEQISKRFVVTPEQHDDILALCKSMVFEAGRDDYNFADEAVQRLKVAAQFPRFKDIFQSKTNGKTITQLVRRQASYTRNAYRQFLRDTLFDGKKKCGLTACVRQACRKFCDGQDPVAELVLHVAILRRFMRDNRNLVALETGDNDPWDDDGDMSSEERETGTGKRKRARTGTHFWGAVTDFFKDKNKQWGKGLRQEGWAAFIDECLRQERYLFPEDHLPHIPQRTVPAAAHPVPALSTGLATILDSPLGGSQTIMPVMETSEGNMHDTSMLGAPTGSDNQDFASHDSATVAMSAVFTSQQGAPFQSRSSSPSSIGSPIASSRLFCPPNHDAQGMRSPEPGAEAHPQAQAGARARPRPRPRPIYQQNGDRPLAPLAAAAGPARGGSAGPSTGSRAPWRSLPGIAELVKTGNASTSTHQPASSPYSGQITQQILTRQASASPYAGQSAGFGGPGLPQGEMSYPGTFYPSQRMPLQPVTLSETIQHPPRFQN